MPRSHYHGVTMRFPSLLLLALAAVLSSASVAPSRSDESAELVAEFKRYYNAKRPAGDGHAAGDEPQDGVREPQRGIGP